MFSSTKASLGPIFSIFITYQTLCSQAQHNFSKIYHDVKAVTSSPCDKCFRYPVDYSHI